MELDSNGQDMGGRGTRCDDQAYARLVSPHFPICLHITIPLVQHASLSISRIPAQLPTKP
jgi:hypothetical protein